MNEPEVPLNLHNGADVPTMAPSDVEGDTETSASARYEMSRMSRKSFAWAGAAVLGGYGMLKLINSRREEDGIIWPFRTSFIANEQIQRDLYAPRLAPTFDAAQGVEPIVNFDEDNLEDIDVADWRLSVEGLYGHNEPLSLEMKDLKILPQVEQATEFKCIEGWSAIVNWKGIRLLDLADHLGPMTKDGKKPDVKNAPGNIVEYVAMETVEGAYYVGLDTLSALHPQTLLAFEMNGKPLTMEHGFPMRLVIPTKYGIKNIKRIGTIRFTSERPKDFWAEQGYDWYAGL